MTRSRLGRLAAMPARELSGRAAMALGQRLDAVTWKVRRPAWRRASLARVLDRAVPGMDRAARCLAAGDAHEAHRALSAHFASRPARFVVAPSDRERIVGLIGERFPGAAADARARADAVLSGSYSLLGYQGLRFTTPAGDIDWHYDPVHGRHAPSGHWTEVPYLDPGIGDHKVIWELNRHQHWPLLGRAYWLTGDALYRRGVLDQLGSWLRANPPRTGVNWASMLELAFRCLSWIWALHLFAEGADCKPERGDDGEEPWTVDLLLGLHEQLQLVERNLSTWFSPNTHLLGEALALYVAGQVLPELRDARRWAARGRSVLVDEIARQIHADGGHAELSTHYHRYTLDFYLLALAVARLTSDGDAAVHFEPAALRLARFAHAISDSHLRLPQIGDDDGGMLLPLCRNDAADVSASLAVAATLLREPDLSDGGAHEEAVWMTGHAPAAAARPDRRRSIWLQDTGYAVCRTGRGDHLVMDVGPLGYLNGGHAHADALSLTLTVAGTPLLVDTGTGCYTIDTTIRDQRRGTSAHNTVSLDRRWQSQPGSSFQWRSRAASALHVCRFSSQFDYVEASHDGYGVDGHTRQLFSRPGAWIIVDWIGGTGRRHAAVHWHIDPSWEVVPRRDGTLELQHASGARTWMVSLTAPLQSMRAADDGLGWYAPVYGALRPLTTVLAEQEAQAPFALATVIVESAAEPVLELLQPGEGGAAGAAARRLAFRLHAADWVETVVAGAPGGGDVSGVPFGVAAEGRFLCARAGRRGSDLWTIKSEPRCAADEPATRPQPVDARPAPALAR